ncbi:MAG: hypothetical protein U0871_17480 [Gemmataceae bacterium]
MSNPNLPLIVAAAIGGAVMAASVLVAVYVFPAADGGPNLPLMLGGIGVGSLIDAVGVVLTLKARSR